MVKVSIIVPVFNVEKYISRCLSSLVNQTLENIEIIIINDGSQDDSIEIIRKYLQENPTKIKYFEKENGGLSSARNLGIKCATGEYIAFLDSDDYVERNMYEEMYNLAKKEDADMCECDFIWEWENGKKRKDIRRKYKNKKKMLERPRVVAWNRIIKRNLIEENTIRFPEGLIYEDLEFYYKIMPFINRISYINKCFVHYIQRKKSISNTQNEKTGDIFKILEDIIDFYRENKLYEKYEKELKYMCKRILLGSSIRRIIKIKDLHLRRKLLLKTIIYLYLFGIRQKRTDLSKKEPTPAKKNRHQLKICFGITKLGTGGAERVLVDIANELESEYDITIFTIYGGGELEKELNKNIKIVSMYDQELKNKFLSLFILIFGKHIYNKYLKGKYDIDIAFLEGPITRILSNKGNKKKIAWVHNDISKVFGNGLISKIKNWTDKWFYKKYNKIIFVSEQNKKSFEDLYGDISQKKVIYNYINERRIIEMAEKFPSPIDPKRTVPNGSFLTVSRLVKQKGIDRFIRVHKRLIDEGFFHKVYVVGEGEEKERLLELVRKLKVEDTFIFLGKKENPYPYMKSVHYFTLLSYFEGYGMVIEEAKILNKPIIITNTAATEAIRDYDKKLIIKNDEESIYRELKNILLGKYEYLNNSEKTYVYDNKHLLDDIKRLLR